MSGKSTRGGQVRLLAMLVVAAVVVAGCSRGDGGSSESGDASGKTHTLRLSHVSTPESAHGQGIEMFKQKVEEKSEGRLKVEIFPNSSLYGQEDELQALQSGSVDMVTPTTASATSVSDRFYLFDLPFVFGDVEDIPELLSPEHPIGKGALYENPDLAERNLQVLGVAYSGFKHLTSNKPMHEPADMRGLKMRVQPSDVLRAQMQAWGASAVAMPFAELYNALQQGVVDGQDNPYTSIFSTKVSEVQSDLTELNHGYNLIPLMINQQAYDALPADLQDVLREAGQETSEEHLQITEKVNAEAKKGIEDAGGTTIYVPTVAELEQWRQAVVPSVWDKYSGKIGPDLVNELKSYHGI